jgi:hypothetical protein
VLNHLLPGSTCVQVEAVKVLLEHVPEGGLQRAFDYASKVGCDAGGLQPVGLRVWLDLFSLGTCVLW